jgi:predicted ATPase/class 3 adenylate cyclase
MELPGGTVSLLFTDIEGSTRLLGEVGDAYADLLAEHRRSLRASFERHGGIELDTWGDAFFVVFTSAAAAMVSAKEAQVELESASPIRVRIGIHTGEPIRTDEGYVGMDVHRAARIAAAGHGGQILLSRATYELVDPTGLLDLGMHRLKDVGEMHLYQVGDRPFPPITGARSTNLPAMASAMLGREAEREDVLRVLGDDGVRLVTVTGTGGIGKTRLAVEVAGAVADSYRDGAWFVDLSAVFDLDLLEPAIGDALGTTAELTGFLKDRNTLLVLDNFEQIVGAAGTVASLLTLCPGLKCLVTSREALRIQGEHEYPLQPLAEAAAVDLFVQRARRLDPNFEPDHDVVARLCSRLDGIPLAIELAAARVRLLGARELLARLEARLPVLTSTARDAPERHRTLEATIAWSYQLLDSEERELFARLSIFVGGWTLEAAEDVCDAKIDVLEALVDKSLVRSERGRFDLFATIRDDAAERLRSDGHWEPTQDRHAAYYAALVERAEPQLTGPEQHVWVSRLADDYENVRAVLERTTDTDAGKGKGKGLQLRLAAGLALFWFLRGMFEEGLRWLEPAIARSEGDRSRARAMALWGAALLRAVTGDEGRSLALAEECLALARSLGDGSMIARSLSDIGLLAFFRNDVATARSSFEEGITFARETHDDWCLVDALGTLGSFYPLQGEFERSRELATEALDLAQQNDDRQGTRQALFALALCDTRLGRLDQARKAAEEGLAICRVLGDLFFCSYFLWILALVATEAGDLTMARASADESLRLAKDVEAPLLIVCALEASAGVALAEGDVEGAGALLMSAMEIGSRGMVPSSYLATVHRRFGEVALARGDDVGARNHLEASLSIAREVGDTWGIDRTTEILAHA